MRHIQTGRTDQMSFASRSFRTGHRFCQKLNQVYMRRLVSIYCIDQFYSQRILFLMVYLWPAMALNSGTIWSQSFHNTIHLKDLSSFTQNFLFPETILIILKLQLDETETV